MRLNRKGRVRLARLEAAVATMEDITREIFLMLRVDGLAYPEIGARLSRSKGSILRCLPVQLAPDVIGVELRNQPSGLLGPAVIAR
ncbi:sigma factor-like helix-turn-helix DNA-binding protein [Sphingomonas sp. OTU376]|uniref:sigma factor-like helix-turn-helix DNA-binding protein n=1 Tax=Sphingomonas sp. OTU376 TaxID=3043863 RepID=UPI00313BBE98